MGKARKTMSNRERIEALLRREKPDRVPIWPFAYAGFAALYSGLTIADAYQQPELVLQAERKACDDFDWVFQPSFGYASYGAWEFGGEIKWPAGKYAQAPTVLKYPVETPEDVFNLRPPDPATAGMIPLMKRFSKAVAREKYADMPFKGTTAGACSSFSLACNICGPERLLRWMIKAPDVAHHLLRIATDHMLFLAEAQKEARGTEGVLPRGGEPTSANQLISPRQFEQFAFPYIKECHDKMLAMGYRHFYCHICGEHNYNLPLWKQVSFGDPGILSIGHEIALETASRCFPDEIILGNLDPAIIQTGTPEEIYEATRKNILEGKGLSNGYIFSPGCDMPPMANREQVMAMTLAVQDHGWYE
ncbi:uroporphyrinogen decarboxylase family protein [Thermodesulfobacteriota bacterium]